MRRLRTLYEKEIKQCQCRIDIKSLLISLSTISAGFLCKNINAQEYHFFVISIESSTYILTGDTIEIIKTMGPQTVIHSMYPIRLCNCKYNWHIIFDNACD